jgi:hypothetical protein
MKNLNRLVLSGVQFRYCHLNHIPRLIFIKDNEVISQISLDTFTLNK